MVKTSIFKHVQQNIKNITIYIQGVPGGMCQTSGECSLGHTIPIYPKTPISKVQWLRRYWPEKSVDFFGVCVVYSVRDVIRLTFTATILQ